MDQGGGVLELHTQELKMPHAMIMQDFGRCRTMDGRGQRLHSTLYFKVLVSELSVNTRERLISSFCLLCVTVSKFNWFHFSKHSILKTLFNTYNIFCSYTIIIG